MFCPKCLHANPVNSKACVQCEHYIGSLREQLFIGQQFVFIAATEKRPLAVQVDGQTQSYRSATILSRHRHDIAFGDENAEAESRGLLASLLPEALRSGSQWPLSDRPRLAPPNLQLLTVVTDRKIYKPATEATLFILAPDAAGENAAVEVNLAGQKVYEAKVALNSDGLAVHQYDDLKEGEYTAVVTLPGNITADCSFSVAEFTLSPLVATLVRHAYETGRLRFTLDVRLVSQPYTGPVELGLQCKVCGNRIVATQQVEAKEGTASGDFDLTGHGGPFHVQVVTPDGNTALIAFPGTGSQERERILLNNLGVTAEMALLPWAEAQPVRGFFVGQGETNMTPLLLVEPVAERGALTAATNLALVQINTFNARTGALGHFETADVKRGQRLEFPVEAPFTFITVAAFPVDEKKDPFEGWSVVIRPVAFTATVRAPQTARPGSEIDVYVEIPPAGADTDPLPAFCWLLVYDARLEHESPLPKLARRIYDSVRNASASLVSHPVANVLRADSDTPKRMSFTAGAPMMQAMVREAGVMPLPPMATAPAAAMRPQSASRTQKAFAPDTVVTDTAVMVMSPTRMEFPELAYQEFFHMAGQAARTVRLGDQIGTWRVRAYICRGVDVQELTADVQAEKALFAEMDTPAIASEGDQISAVVNYQTPEAAELIIATPYGESRSQVEGSGRQHFTVRGPGRMEVYLNSGADSDWSVRHISPPGIQKVTASRLLLLDQGETVTGDRVVVYPTMGQVLKSTITALIDYPFG
jgi:hypothetical protein